MSHTRCLVERRRLVGPGAHTLPAESAGRPPQPQPGRSGFALAASPLPSLLREHPYTISGRPSAVEDAAIGMGCLLLMSGASVLLGVIYSGGC